MSGYQILAQVGRRQRLGATTVAKGTAAPKTTPPPAPPAGNKDPMDTAFVVARDVDKGLAGILNAVIPGVGTAASQVTQLWLDPLQQEITKKPVVKDNKPSAFLAPAGGAGGAQGGGSGTEAEKKVLAEKAILEAAASKAKADAKPGDAVLAAAAQSDAAKAQTLAVEAKILLPVAAVPKKMSTGVKVAIVGGAIVGGLGVIALVVKLIFGGRP